MKRTQAGIIDLIVLGIYALIALGVAAAAYAAWHTFTNSYREEGRAEVRTTYALLIEHCDKSKQKPAECAAAWDRALDDARTASNNFASCSAAAAVQTQAVTAAETASKNARAATARILAEIAKRSQATQAEIGRLTQQAATPAANRKEACDAADSLLSTLATRRMRYNPGPAPGAADPNAGGPGAGSGALRIGK